MADHLPSTRRVLQGEVVDTTQKPAPLAAVDWLELVSFLMDRLFTVPGTQKRFGLNSLMLLLPILGDILPTLISFGIIIAGITHYRVPRIVAVRMVLNSLLDACLSWIPVVGNLWDVWFKADTRNVALLREHVGSGESPSTWKHWLFVGGLLLLLLVVLVLLVAGSVLLISQLSGVGRAGRQ